MLKNWAFASVHVTPFALSIMDSIKLLRKPVSNAWSTEPLSFLGTLGPLCRKVHTSAMLHSAMYRNMLKI